MASAVIFGLALATALTLVVVPVLSSLVETTSAGVLKRAGLLIRRAHLACKIDENHELTKKCVAAYRKVFGCDPIEFDFWNFSTNAVIPGLQARYANLKSSFVSAADLDCCYGKLITIS